MLGMVQSPRNGSCPELARDPHEKDRRFLHSHRHEKKSFRLQTTRLEESLLRGPPFLGHVLEPPWGEGDMTTRQGAPPITGRNPSITPGRIGKA